MMRPGQNVSATMSTRTNGGDKRREKNEKSETKKFAKTFTVVCLINMLITNLTPELQYRRRRERPTNATTTVSHKFGHSHSINFSLCPAGANGRREVKKNSDKLSVVFIFLSSFDDLRSARMFFRSLLFVLLFVSCHRTTNEIDRRRERWLRVWTEKKN